MLHAGIETFCGENDEHLVSGAVYPFRSPTSVGALGNFERQRGTEMRSVVTP